MITFAIEGYVFGLFVIYRYMTTALVKL